MDDIRDIDKIFRTKDMLLELDLVLNHSSDEYEWIKKALDGEKEYQDMYYQFDDRSIPDLFEKTLPEVFPTTDPGNFTYIESLNKWVFKTFSNFQWDLNYSNHKVFIEMTKILFHLTNQGGVISCVWMLSLLCGSDWVPIAKTLKWLMYCHRCSTWIPQLTARIRV